MIDRIRFARWLQQGSFYMLLFLLPISKASIEITFPFLLIGWIAERMWSGGWHSSVWSRVSLRPLLIALLTYLGICAVSILTSSSPMHSVRGFVCKTLEYALFGVIAADVAMHLQVHRVVIVLLCSAATVGLDAVIQELIGADPLLHHVPTVYGRMTGPYENPSDLATYLIVTLLLAITLLRDSQIAGKGRVGLWALVVLLGGCLVRTESQSAWIGFAVGVVLVMVLDRSLRGPLGMIVSVLTLVAVALLLKEGRLRGVLTFTDPGAEDRIVMWQAGWHMVRDHPIIGLGLNTFMANYLTYWVGGERQPRYAHNCYLQTAAETGLLGLTSFLAFLWLLFKRLLTGIQQATSEMRFILLGLTAGFLSFAVQAAADTNFYAMRQVTLFWVLAGLAVGFSERETASMTSAQHAAG